jgi:hypothetical protein
MSKIKGKDRIHGNIFDRGLERIAAVVHTSSDAKLKRARNA